MWTLFKLINLIYLMVSSYVWFSFLLPGNYIPVVVSIIMLTCFAFGGFNIRMTKRVYALSCILILYFLYNVYILGISYGLLSLFSYIPAVLLFMLDISRQEQLLRFVTKWFSIIMGISISVYLIENVLSLPHFSFLPKSLEMSYLPFDNYIFFLKNKMYETELVGINRFSGPFLEPGHQSLICSLLLFANRFRMKDLPCMWILVVSIFISFSLAGYLILLIGFCLIVIKNIVTLVSLGLVFLGSWYGVSQVWNEGNNPINVLIVNRLQFDSSKGIAGNNRTIIQTDYFFKHCVEDGTIWTGVRTQEEMRFKIRGAGYKIFMLRYGIVACCFVTCIYLLLIPRHTNSRYAISFFILIILIFLQRSYPGWYSWLLPYTLGLGIMRNQSFHNGGLINSSEFEEEIIDENDKVVIYPVT